MLVRAVKSNDDRRVMEALRAGADPNTTGYRSSMTVWLRRAKAGLYQPYRNPPPLVVALDRYNLENDPWPDMFLIPKENVTIIAALLKYGADPNATNMSGVTPLMLAAGSNKRATVGLLLARGANIDQQNNDGKTALCVAADSNSAEVVLNLLKHGANSRLTDKRSTSPLIAAVNCGNVAVVEALLQAGADVNGRDKSGNTALGYAAQSGRVDICHELTSYGAHR